MEPGCNAIVRDSLDRDYPSLAEDCRVGEMNLRIIEIEEFVRRLHADTNADKCFAVFLGAGCSVSSGIPSAGTLVQDYWIPRLRDLVAPARSDLGNWTTEAIPGFDPANPALSYGELINRLFVTPVNRQQEIENLCEGRTPSFGYAVLAQLVAMEGGRFNIVLTTNFDDLMADALYLYTDTRPLVIPHESLATFIRPTRTRPLVVKLHGDHRLAPRNTALETKELRQEIQSRTAMVLHDRGIMFLGYGGNDLGIIKLLDALPDEALPFGAYWIHPYQPQGKIRDWLERRHGVWVPIGSFDEAMLLIQNEFDLPHPSADRFTRIFQEYHEKLRELSASIRAKATSDVRSRALSEAIVETEARLPDFWKVMSEASRLQRKDPDRANEVYQQGVMRFPKAAPLLGDYANFLFNVRKDSDAAEEMHERALAADPKHANNMCNYAIFLHTTRKDYEAAEKMYEAALRADPSHASTLDNYAFFLSHFRKDYDAAQKLYERALAGYPVYASTFGNYAIFLTDVRKDYDAAETMYKRALAAYPKDANVLGDYAWFLMNIRKNYDAVEEMYERALAAGPTHKKNILNYARFLKRIRKDYHAAEAMYSRARSL